MLKIVYKFQRVQETRVIFKVVMEYFYMVNYIHLQLCI